MDDEIVKEGFVRLTLPMPPTDNRYYGKPKGARHKYLTKSAKLFRHEVAIIVAQQRVRGAFPRGPVGITVVLHLHHGGDIWNRLKGLGDALEYSGVISNDSQIDDSTIKRGEPVKGGLCEVTIWRI